MCEIENGGCDAQRKCESVFQPGADVNYVQVPGSDDSKGINGKNKAHLVGGTILGKANALCGECSIGLLAWGNRYCEPNPFATVQASFVRESNGRVPVPYSYAIASQFDTKKLVAIGPFRPNDKDDDFPPIEMKWPDLGTVIRTYTVPDDEFFVFSCLQLEYDRDGSHLYCLRDSMRMRKTRDESRTNIVVGYDTKTGEITKRYTSVIATYVLAGIRCVQMAYTFGENPRLILGCENPTKQTFEIRFVSTIPDTVSTTVSSSSTVYGVTSPDVVIIPILKGDEGCRGAGCFHFVNVASSMRYWYAIVSNDNDKLWLFSGLLRNIGDPITSQVFTSELNPTLFKTALADDTVTDFSVSALDNVFFSTRRHRYWYRFVNDTSSAPRPLLDVPFSGDQIRLSPDYRSAIIGSSEAASTRVVVGFIGQLHS